MASKLVRMVCVLGTLLTLAGSTSAQGTFAYRKAITINQNVGRPVLNDFPVMISINGDVDLITKVQSANGDDIEFKAADGVTKLDFEIDWFNQGSGTLEAWVKIPTLSPGANTIYMDYGNAQITSSPANPCTVWDQDYIGVWHLGESGSGAVNEYGDSSPYDNDGQGGEGDPLFVPTRVNGRIGFAQHFDNSDTKYDLVDCGDDALFDVTGNQITLQAWVQHSIVPPQSHNYGILAHKGWSDGYSLWVNGNPFDCPGSALCVAFLAQGTTHQLKTNGVVSAGSWHHVVATYDGATMRVYIDGAPDANTLAKTNNMAPSVSESDLWIGHGDQPKDKGWSAEWEGDIDEVRISRIARSADWIATEYDNQSTTCRPASAFCNVGAETPGSYGVNVTQTNYRSIGTGGIVASAGTATSTASSATVSFSASLPANVGKGDRLTLDPLGTPEVLYILSRDSANQVTVQSPSGLSRTVPFEIARAYATLAGWEQDIGSGGRGGNLVGDDRREVGVVYKDGPLAGGVTISGSTTDCAHDMVLTSPQGQQHLGVANTGAVIDNGASASPAIRILDDFATVEWLEIKGGGGAAADAIEIGAATAGANLTRVRYNILHDTGGDGVRLSDADSVAEVFNNVIYETSYGVHLTADLANEARVNVFSNTIYGSNGSGGLPSAVTSDVRQTSVRVDLRNNIAHSNTNGDFGVVPFFERAYFCNPGCTQIANGGTVPSATEYLADPANDFTLSFAAGTDYLYLGSSNMFRGFSVNLATQGTGSPNLQWEYWNGGAWTNLESNGFANYNSDFLWQGGAYWPDDPVGWTPTSVSGSPALYYVRGRLASGSYTTLPVEDWIVPIGVHVGSRNNLSGDLSANSHSLFYIGVSGVASVPLGNLNFISTSAGTENLHITAGSAAEDTAFDLSTYLTGDIDAALRTTLWDIGADDISATTAVELVRFQASGFDGKVELEWETGSEMDNLGFHLDRATRSAGPWTRLTDTLIPGLGSSPEGARYRFVDSDVVNGTTYFYRLADIDTSAQITQHGPVTATPREDAGECCGEESPGTPSVTFGEPSRSRLEMERTENGVVLVLFTEGFQLAEGVGGTKELTVPGYDTTVDDGRPSLPIRRSWVEAVAGRKVKLAAIQSFDEVVFEAMTLEPAGEPEIEARWDGTVRASRRRNVGRAARGGFYPEQVARLVDVGFQGDTKKALVEMAPLRWDGEKLVLARRIVVRLVFEGREDLEVVTAGGRFRRYRGRSSHEDREVLARLRVRVAGLQAVRFEDIQASGRGTGLSSSALRLSRLGESIAFHIEPDDTAFRAGSTLYFVSPVMGTAVYELEPGGNGLPMAQIDGHPSGEELPFYWHEERIEENRYYQAALLDVPDRWLWDLLFSGTRKSFSIEASDLAPASIPSRLRVWLSGASNTPASPDHHLRVYLNETLIDEVEFDGKESFTIEADVPAGVVVEGTNAVTLESVDDTGASYSMVMLDAISLTYPRLPRVSSGWLEGEWSGAGAASAIGIDQGYALDVTGDEPAWLTSVVSGSGALRFRAESGRRYLVVSAEAVQHPEVTAVPAGHLKDGHRSAEYLLIGPREFLESARPLIEQRRRQGLRAEAVAVEEIYSEFGFGEARAEAIRDFLVYAYHRWSPPSLRYVLLLGDATYDTQDYLGTGVVNRVPALMVRTSYLWTASDPTYATVNGDDDLPDIAIGRLPAATVPQAEVMIEKILAYERTGSPAGAPVVLVADNADAAGDFPAEARRLASSVLAGKEVAEIRVGATSVSDTRQAIVSAFDSGAYLVSYLGHGGIHLWASENVLDIDGVGTLGPSGEQPIVLTMNCLNGYFHFPYFDALGEALLKAPAKGAIAAFSPTGLSLNDPARQYHEALLTEIFSGAHEHLGDAVLATQSRYANTGSLPELLTIYHLLGDPALVIRSTTGN